MASSTEEVEQEEEEEEGNNALETFQKEFCGLNAKPNSNEYITEYVLPQTCEMPLGKVVDDEENKVWYVSTSNPSSSSASFIVKLTSGSSSTTRICCFVKDIMMSMYNS